jgi:hypothetical protein
VAERGLGLALVAATLGVGLLAGCHDRSLATADGSSTPMPGTAGSGASGPATGGFGGGGVSGGGAGGGGVSVGGAGGGGVGGGGAGGQGTAGAFVDAALSDAGFAWDFAARASAALAAGAPSWTCATALPTVPVADTNAVHDVIHAFVAQVVAVSVADVTENDPPCGAPMNATCANHFAHDCAKSGGNIYDTVVPLATELEATAQSVEETIWVPTSMTGDVAMSGISDGMLVGMIVFNGMYPCR